MNILRVIGSELIGLFVDDGMFAGAIILWVVLIGVAAAVAISVPAYWRGILLFVGLAVILIESVTRRARSS